jgi:hypothetical protein
VPGHRSRGPGLSGVEFWDTTGHVEDILYHNGSDSAGPRVRLPDRSARGAAPASNYYALPAEDPVIPVGDAAGAQYPAWWHNAAPNGGAHGASHARGAAGRGHGSRPGDDPAGVPSSRTRPFAIAEAENRAWAEESRAEEAQRRAAGRSSARSFEWSLPFFFFSSSSFFW